MEDITRSTFSPDQPKESLADDRLGYAAFARAIAKSIKAVTVNDGLVLAIHGGWGSGKTSTVNMVVDALAEMQADLSENQKTVVHP